MELMAFASVCALTLTHSQAQRQNYSHKHKGPLFINLL